jgi:two-component system, chemotaxis family, response regulator PixG
MSSGILQQLQFCSNKRFTGKLSVISLDGSSIDNLQGHCWNLFFYRGRLVGDSVGVHPIRRMRRQFSRLSITLPPSIEDELLSSAGVKNRNYFGISELLANQYIDRDQAEQIIAGSLVEVLFDIFQYEAIAQINEKSRLSCILENDKPDEVSVPSVLLKPEPVWEKALDQLLIWKERGLMKYSPNLCPEIHDYIKFQAIVSEKTYTKIVNLLDSDRTLRDIATKIDEDVSIIAKGLSKYHDKRVLSFHRIADISPTGKRLSTNIQGHGSDVFNEFSAALTASKRKLVAHLGNNDPEKRAIQSIVEKAGHDYINMQEPTEAMLALLRSTPAMIVVDSAFQMNAYDFCSQLRRTNKFRETPIILLSEGDSMLGWMRTRMSSYNETIAKPISHQKIFKVVDKYLLKAAS